MILRRISQGIRQQDWFVVGVEILTVVIGIFIGLQVDDWNEERKDRALEVVYLEKLKDEAMRSLEVIDAWQQTSDQTQADARWFVGYDAAQEDIGATEVNEFYDRIGSVFFDINPVSLQQSTFNELISTGGLNILGSHAVREKILNVDLLHQNLNRRQNDKHDLFVNSIDPYMINTYNAAGLARMMGGQEMRNVTRLDPQLDRDLRVAMMQDEKLRSLAIYRDGIQSLVVGNVQEIKDEYLKLVRLLDSRIAEIG